LKISRFSDIFIFGGGRNKIGQQIIGQRLDLRAGNARQDAVIGRIRRQIADFARKCNHVLRNKPHAPKGGYSEKDRFLSESRESAAKMNRLLAAFIEEERLNKYCKGRSVAYIIDD